MKDIIWLFPLLFIFHDLEEIIGFIPWLQRNERLLAKKATAILKTHKDLSTEGFALAVAEEFVVVLFVAFFALFYHTRFLYLIWLGGFVAFALHVNTIELLVFSLIGILIVIVNLFFALWLGKQFSARLN